MITKISSTINQAPKYRAFNNTENVSFKELNNRGHGYPQMTRREEIELKYEKRREDLYEKADWLDMASDIFFEELKKIDADERAELDNYESSIRRY